MHCVPTKICPHRNLSPQKFVPTEICPHGNLSHSIPTLKYSKNQIPPQQVFLDTNASFLFGHNITRLIVFYESSNRSNDSCRH